MILQNVTGQKNHGRGILKKFKTVQKHVEMFHQCLFLELKEVIDAKMGSVDATAKQLLRPMVSVIPLSTRAIDCILSFKTQRVRNQLVYFHAFVLFFMFLEHNKVRIIYFLLI